MSLWHFHIRSGNINTKLSQIWKKWPVESCQTRFSRYTTRRRDGDSSSRNSGSPSLAGCYTSAVNKSERRGIAVTVILFLVWVSVTESVSNWHFTASGECHENLDVYVREALLNSSLTLLRRWAGFKRSGLLFKLTWGGVEIEREAIEKKFDMCFQNLIQRLFLYIFSLKVLCTEVSCYSERARGLVIHTAEVLAVSFFFFDALWTFSEWQLRSRAAMMCTC